MSILEVKDLHTSFFTPNGEAKAVDGVTFSAEKGEVLGIVGESGSGKSVTAYSIMQILDKPGRIVSGSIRFNGSELVGSGERVMRTIRGNKISMIFQDPMTSLNPVYTIKNQLIEGILLHTGRTHEEAEGKALEMLKMVGVNDPEKRLHQYPHELSGGMRQRVMIAMALACEPDILIADEPTTALDVTIQAQILEIIKNLEKMLGMTTILITHDLGVVAEMCDRILVMYGGKIAESGTADQIFYSPRHEYTKGLLRSIPSARSKKERLIPIGGSPVDLLNMPKGCAFCPRCEKALKVCLERRMDDLEVAPGHYTSCWMALKEMIDKENLQPKEEAALCS
jgi:oligopeptide transport system ATP-binding protein